MTTSESSSSLIDVVFGAPASQTSAGADRASLFSLLAANILPIIMAIMFGWDVGDVVIFYWWENLIIGLWVIPRLLMAKSNHTQLLKQPGESRFNASRAMPNNGMQYEKILIIPFFCFHYFFFCFVHGIFVHTIARGLFNGTTGASLPFDTSTGDNWLGPLVVIPFLYQLLANSLQSLSTGGLVAVAGLLISHGISFFRNFIGHGEYLKSHVMFEMFRPYPRIVVLHLGIIIGGIATMLFGSPLILVIILMIGKTLLDAKLHLFSHGGAGNLRLSPH